MSNGRLGVPVLLGRQMWKGNTGILEYWMGAMEHPQPASPAKTVFTCKNLLITHYSFTCQVSGLGELQQALQLFYERAWIVIFDMDVNGTT
jgi:hypothetical protein